MLFHASRAICAVAELVVLLEVLILVFVRMKKEFCYVMP